VIAVAMLIAPATSGQNLGPEFGAKGADNAGSIELNNMPFSNDKGDGFENKIARLLAEKLNKDVAYTYYPGATGFIRNTLNAHLCDVVLGMPQGNDLVQPTNPYYRTTYAIVTRAGSDLADLKSLDDPRLKENGRHIGLVANTPPGNLLAANGSMGAVRPYALMVDTRIESSSAAMIADLEKADRDADSRRPGDADEFSYRLRRASLRPELEARPQSVHRAKQSAA
jgi:ABC-type amino acid transport substrate-binding protein